MSLVEDLKDSLYSFNEDIQKKCTREQIREQLIELIRLTEFKRFVNHVTSM